MPAWLRPGPINWELDTDDLPRVDWIITTHDGWTRVANGYLCDCGELCGTETVWRNHAAGHGLKWGTTAGQPGHGRRWSDIAREIAADAPVTHEPVGETGHSRREIAVFQGDA